MNYTIEYNMLKQIKIESVHDSIACALEKLSLNREVELCRYIPDINGSGHIHHFTFRKMMLRSPDELIKLIDENILNKNVPKKLPVKQRIRKTKQDSLLGGKINLGKIELYKILEIMKKVGETGIAEKLLPYSSIELAMTKKEIRYAIRHNSALDLKLVDDYNRLVNMLYDTSEVK